MFTNHALSCRRAANSNDFDLIKALGQAELALYHQHLLRLGWQCRRSRFGNETSDQFLRGYVDRVDLANTAVLGYFSEDGMRGAIELRSLRSVWCEAAEVALSVEPGWRSQGVGSALMMRTLELARGLGVERVFLICDRMNRPMQRIAEKACACICFERSECLAQISLPRLQHHEGSHGRYAA